AACFFGVPSFSAMCETIFVLLSGLAAIYFAYPPEFSFHPGAAGTSRGFLRLPHFHGEKTRAAPEYSQVGKGTQVKMLENWAKMKIFFWHCGFSGQKQRFFGRLPPDFRPFPGACLGMARIGLIFAPLWRPTS